MCMHDVVYHFDAKYKSCIYDGTGVWLFQKRRQINAHLAYAEG